ncbi:hypothetical protein GCM10011348_19340 [Marinobacterium nitratireducens]|uniref:Uncharacterized protein n=1 Tax=Marinobacterium nitratireducens TaxID=518897 RepID=A0A917ZE13_9GAMM|nr:hypothetical protein [Marinobacterium nitratireducens]GGO81091.1 hypothetical protein GCM10011348_19340 [Marinobacterium nitratireducens]
MFIKIKKNSGIHMEHNGLEKQHLVPVTSNFLLNLNQVAEVSFYSIKETKTRYDLEHHAVQVPPHTRVIHLQMSYPYGSRDEHSGVDKGVLIERCYYKLYFMPEETGQYDVIRGQIEALILNDD